jgi:hypothetical protein
MMSSSAARKPDDLTTFGKLSFEPPLLKAAPLARWSQHPSQHLAGGWRRGRDGIWFFACHHPDRPAAGAAGPATAAHGPAADTANDPGGAGLARGRKRGRLRAGRERRPGGRRHASITWSSPKVRDTALVRLGAQRVRLQLLVSPCDGTAVLAAYREGEETSFSAQKLPGQPVGEAGEARRTGLLRAFQLPDDTPAVALRLFKQDTSTAKAAAAPDAGAGSPGDGGPAAGGEKSALTGVVYALHDDGLTAVWEHELSRHEPGQPGFRCDFKIGADRQTIDYRCSEGKDPALEASAGVYRWDGAQYVFDKAPGSGGSSAGSAPAPTPPVRAAPGATGLPHVEPAAPPAPPPTAPAPAPSPPPAVAPPAAAPDPSADP